MKRWISWKLIFPALPAVIIGVALLAGIWNLFFEAEPRPPRHIVQLAIIHIALDKYKADFGAFPSGDSEAVSRALLGSNSNKIHYIHLSGSTKNLIDPWGTPYLIYFSGDKVLVRSAGPNKRFDSYGDKGFDDFIM